MKNLKDMKFSSMREMLARHKWLLIVLVAILAIGGYALWSKYTWDGYENRYTVWHGSARMQFSEVLKRPVTTEKDRVEKLKALKQGSSKVSMSKDTLCSVSQLIAWQSILKSLEVRIKECRDKVAAIEAFNDKLHTVTAYVEFEQAVSKILRSAPNKTPVTESDFDAQVAGWHDISAKIEKLPTDSYGGATKQAMEDSVERIDAAWQALIAAHKAKDKSKYMNAQSQLAEAYGTFDNVQTVSAAQLKALLDPLQSAYEKAF